MPLPLSRLPTSWSRSIRLAGACSAAAVTILVIAGGAASGYAEAKDNPACEQFDWSIKRELALFANPNLEMVFSGSHARIRFPRKVSLSSFSRMARWTLCWPRRTSRNRTTPSRAAFRGECSAGGRLPGYALRRRLDRSYPERQGAGPFGGDDQRRLRRCPQKHAVPP